MDFRVIDGCPCPTPVAAQVYMVLRRANQYASSIYRGEQAKALLHAHGKHTQTEIHNDPKYHNISNPPGFSQHELFDGNGNRIPEWHVGVDSGGNDATSKANIEAAARHFGWTVYHPYSAGVEGHHWAFLHEPKPKNKRQKLRIALLKRTLPKK